MRVAVPKGPDREVVREGVSEVRDKLRADLSRWGRARRAVSLKPIMSCADCDATGRVTCPTCEGSGKSRLVMGEKPDPCPTCEGKGSVSCVMCAGKGEVPNVHRKKVLGILIAGAAAWLFFLVRLYMMDHDLLPGFRPSGGGQALPAGGGASRGGPSAGVTPAANDGVAQPPGLQPTVPGMATPQMPGGTNPTPLSGQ